ncbi:MAG: hypothetical protein QW356_08110, partial [Candidatus Hadarchaeales archaeon]
MRKSISILLIMLLFQQSHASIEITLQDTIVNPYQTILIQGSASLESTRVDVRIDNSLYPYFFDQGSWGGTRENVAVSGGSLSLAFITDFDLAYIAPDNSLRLVDVSGNLINTSFLAQSVGGYADVDGDGDVDLAFADNENKLSLLDFAGNTRSLRANVINAGGIGDMDRDGDLDVAFWEQSPTYVGWVDLAGNAVEKVNTVARVGWVADLDGDGDNDLLFTSGGSVLYWIDSAGNLSYLGGLAGVQDVGGVADLNRDGILDFVFVDGGYLKYSNAISKNVTNLGIPAVKVGGIADFDSDGLLEIAFIGPDGVLKLAQTNGSVISLGLQAVDVGGFADFDNDTGYCLSGLYSVTHDWGTPHLKPENIQVNATIVAGTSISCKIELSDDQFLTVKERENFLLSTGINTYVLTFENISRYIRITFYLSTSGKDRSPSLNSFLLNAAVYTDNENFYSCYIQAPAVLGTHTATVLLQGDNENSVSFDVRRLVFDSFLLLDNHGQLDNILNPGENYRLTVRIREDNSSQFYEVTSGSFT